METVVAALVAALTGLSSGLMGVVVIQEKSHQKALAEAIPKHVYENMCKKEEQQATLLAGLSTSVSGLATLVDALVNTLRGPK